MTAAHHANERTLAGMQPHKRRARGVAVLKTNKKSSRVSKDNALDEILGHNVPDEEWLREKFLEMVESIVADAYQIGKDLSQSRVSLRMVGTLSFIPLSHVIGVADLHEVRAAQKALFAGVTGTFSGQWPAWPRSRIQVWEGLSALS